MADDRIALAGLLEKGSDVDVLRQMVAFMTERLMAAVDAQVGAARGERSHAQENWRNGYRERDLHTREAYARQSRPDDTEPGA